MKTAKTTFVVNFTTEFGCAIKNMDCTTGENAEETFKNALNKLPKDISKTWESIEFHFEGDEISVGKEWLHETNFDFSKSHTVNGIA